MGEARAKEWLLHNAYVASYVMGEARVKMGLPAGTSGTPPAAIRSEAFHFFADPAPQCCSNWVQENSRLFSGF